MTTNQLIEEIVEEANRMNNISFCDYSAEPLGCCGGDYCMGKHNERLIEWLKTALTKLQRDTVLVVMPEKAIRTPCSNCEGEHCWLEGVDDGWNSCREAMLSKARELNIEI